MVNKALNLVSGAAALSLLLAGVAPVPAAEENGTRLAAAPVAPSVTGSLTEMVIRGRVQLGEGDVGSIATLQNAAQMSLTPLINAAGQEILTKNPKDMPASPGFYVVARQAAEAHFWWGFAADRFARRDTAITAYARAVRFLAGDKSGAYTAARDAQPNLGGMLTEGLPTIAPDDTLETISSLVHANPVTGVRLWRPLRFSSNLIAGAEPTEFLITDGRLFVTAGNKGILAVVPPPYRKASLDALPKSLRMSNIIAGFVKDKDGPNKGMWRQLVRVHYSHQSLTRNNRDDRPRAEALCLQFLRLHTLAKTNLGMENPYADPHQGITTLWLSEVSALWPDDEDDPAVLAALGRVFMPPVTTPSGIKPVQATEVEPQPFSRPWLAAGQSNNDPGDIVFFKMTEKRSEAEWLRELAHEYGHLLLTPFNGFKPPLEPFGNGAVGEALGMMWAASATDAYARPLAEISAAQAESSMKLVPSPLPAPIVPAFTEATEANAACAREINAHVAANALNDLLIFNAQGASSPLRKDPTITGLQYLRGLTIYLERVYGGATLAAAMQQLPRIAAPPPVVEPLAVTTPPPPGTLLVVEIPIPPPPPLQAAGLLEAAAALKDTFGEGQTRLPVWLGGALSSPSNKLTVPALVAREPGGLKAKERATCWLLVPPSATALHIEWKAFDSQLPLMVEGGWKTLSLPPTIAPATNSMRIETVGRPGWQKIAITAPGDLTWVASWFEKAPAK